MAGPVGVERGGDVRQELAYDNYRSVKYEGEVLRKAMSDVAMSLAMVFRVEEVEHIQ